MQKVAAKEVDAKIKAGEKITLLDVRENDELVGELGHVSGCVHIPLGDLQQRVNELSKDAHIVTICKGGGRAARAASFLEESGFKNVDILDNGMIGWNESGLPVATKA